MTLPGVIYPVALNIVTRLKISSDLHYGLDMRDL